MLVAVIVAGTIGSASPAEGSLTVAGGTVDQRSMADWVIGRFESAGLELPPLEVRFHADRDSCHGRIGYYDAEVAHLCLMRATTDSSRTALHEIAHRWLEVNVTGIERDLFLQLRGLRTWNDKGPVGRSAAGSREPRSSSGPSASRATAPGFRRSRTTIRFSSERRTSS